MNKLNDFNEKIDEAMGFVQKLDYQKGKRGKDSKLKQSVDQPKDIMKAVQNHVKGVQKKINDYYKKSFPNLKPDILKIQKGKRYIKIVRVAQSGSGKSVFEFIDAKEGPTFGNILKAASWKAPAKHARGSVFDGSWGVNSVGPYGPAYLR